MRHEDELRRLLHGGPIPVEDEQLAQVLRELRAELTSAPSEDVAERHLAAITAAAAGAAHEAPTPAPVGRLRRWGRRVAAAGALKIATVATAAVAVTSGGLAATGNLPQPAQDRVSDVLSNVGIHVPSGTDRADEHDPDDLGTEPAEPAVVDSAPPTSTPPVETPNDDPDDVRTPDDTPEEPATADDESLPFEETPSGEPTETPSDESSEQRTDPAADDAYDAPTDPEPTAERSGEADSSTPDGQRDDAPDGPGTTSG